MRVLLSAWACAPGVGSEAGVGWRTALLLSREHEVHVMTSVANKRAIEQVGPLSSAISFSYFGTDCPLHRNMALARSQNWYRFGRWTRESIMLARKLHKARAFDVTHHITLGTVRVASPLWRLPVPFVFGPCGGGEVIPLECFRSLRWREAIWEIARYMNNLSLRASIRVRSCIRNAAATLGSTKKSCELLQKLGADRSTIRRLPSIFLSNEEMRQLPTRSHTRSQTPLTMISGGVLDGRKGVNLALDSVALAKKMGAKVSFIVTCIGPELAHLRNLASHLGLEREVHFQQSLSRSEYLQQLGSADIFFLPSLRDAGPTSLVEAMMTGCVPLVIDCNGPGEHVVEGAGIKVQPGSPTAMAGRFARIIADLSANKSELHALSNGASEHARSVFSEKAFASELSDVYRVATTARRFSSATSR